ncbi:uncharacterized protein E5676_scaffold552G00960 [Cucumis melo var. makuwa]|uniref:Uncharacterized protein n=1 Tax=Cucumis melo var. makuwa TaxID=1194695 RepID=A0A5D3CUC2_CUCMM|nr:uncharacterized protein E6C27_scaffold24G002060 [Cucumis melo var. makuwa]TYK14594.1 uncharacterized protein E5676_scaffold552G00960 [Cucumis melo var. makuwa]
MDGCHVDAVIDDLFREFGSQSSYVGSPSHCPFISPNHFRPPPPSPNQNAEASIVPPSAVVYQNMGNNNIPPPASVHHGFRPQSKGQWVISTKVDCYSTPELITGFLLSQHPDLLADDDVAEPPPRTISLSYKTFQGAYVLDLHATFCPPCKGVGSSRAELPISDDGLHLSRDLAICVMQLLSDELRALIVSVVEL